ncbi:MAG: aconitase X catalytic domain-containing protein [Spirochaetes bacterium]|nr:aconitase X catalytic domain-containing protein [Spirochaetota bacterium]
MVRLTDYERRMLDGEFGAFKQAAIEKIVEYANALGAEELCKVSKATIFFGAHHYLDAVKSEDYNKIFSTMYLCSDKAIPVDKFERSCFSQTCVSPCDQYVWEPLGQTKEFFDKNSRYLDIVHKAGVSIAGSCTPYLIGCIPLKGEHFVTTESSNVVMCNSVFGAYGNSGGIESSAWSAICGRTPKWGLSIPENRLGTVVFNIKCPAETAVDWDVIGYTAGRLLPPHGIPILQGDFPMPNLIKLKQCFAALATTSSAEMCHIVGFTPEAPTLEAALGGKKPRAVIDITPEHYKESMDMICDKGNGDVDFIALGCPHYTLEEIRDTAWYIENKRVAPGVKLTVWADYAIKEMANQNGYTAIIEKAGGHILTGGCPLVVGRTMFEGLKGMATDGAKQAHYIRSDHDAPVYYGSMEQCVDAAIAGKWKGGEF